MGMNQSASRGCDTPPVPMHVNEEKVCFGCINKTVSCGTSGARSRIMWQERDTDGEEEAPFTLHFCTIGG